MNFRFTRKPFLFPSCFCTCHFGFDTSIIWNKYIIIKRRIFLETLLQSVEREKRREEEKETKKKQKTTKNTKV